MSDFVWAYDRLGRKKRIPAHWLTHPRLKAGWTKTPSQKAAETKKNAPVRGDDTTKKGK